MIFEWVKLSDQNPLLTLIKLNALKSRTVSEEKLNSRSESPNVVTALPAVNVTIAKEEAAGPQDVGKSQQLEQQMSTFSSRTVCTSLPTDTSRQVSSNSDEANM